jgi:hypothetical protein
MEYVLPALVIVGVLLFVIGWLVVVVTSFQRHPVTGLVALIPGLNLVTLPSIWHRVSGWVIASFAGTLLAIGAWFMGGQEQLFRQLHDLGVNVSVPAAKAPASAAAPAKEEEAIVHTIPIPPEAHTTPTPAIPSATVPVPLELPKAAVPVAVPVAAPAPVIEPKITTPAPPLPPTEDLPASALYHIVFEEVPVSKLADNTGKYARLTQKNGRKREGKVLSATATNIVLEERVDSGVMSSTLKMDDIRQAAIMTKKQGK